MQADMRDVAAARHEDLVRGLLATATNVKQLRELYDLMRRNSADDRRRAAADRQAEAEDRYAAERDRHHADADRQASAADRQEAALDPLTGAYTRGVGFRALRREVDSAQGALQSLTLAFLDVDGLKAINDAHGHEAGDRSLVRVVGALRTHLRPHDLIIRFGGDEFLCSLTGLDQTEATERLHRVVSALADDALPVSITIGLASLGPHESISDLIQRADEAFYAARRRR